MDVADLKKILVAAKKEPVNCAAGITKDGEAVITMHRTKNARALLAALIKESGILKAPCFGTASIDTDEDPKCVTLSFNKVVTGIGPRLRKSLRGSGVTKVDIQSL
jgi:predicted flap endonuclease-1-like 5' DNA nuclease